MTVGPYIEEEIGVIVNVIMEIGVDNDADGIW